MEQNQEKAKEELSSFKRKAMDAHGCSTMDSIKRHDQIRPLGQDGPGVSLDGFQDTGICADLHDCDSSGAYCAQANPCKRIHTRRGADAGVALINQYGNPALSKISPRLFVSGVPYQRSKRSY